MTQAERVLNWLQERGDLDPMTAWNELGIYRLGARIFDLHKEGHAISRRMKDVSNRFGETCHVACYSLGE